jgi:hypothetical protein
MKSYERKEFMAAEAYPKKIHDVFSDLITFLEGNITITRMKEDIFQTK